MSEMRPYAEVDEAELKAAVGRETQTRVALNLLLRQIDELTEVVGLFGARLEPIARPGHYDERDVVRPMLADPAEFVAIPREILDRAHNVAELRDRLGDLLGRLEV